MISRKLWVSWRYFFRFRTIVRFYFIRGKRQTPLREISNPITLRRESIIKVLPHRHRKSLWVEGKAFPVVGDPTRRDKGNAALKPFYPNLSCLLVTGLPTFRHGVCLKIQFTKRYRAISYVIHSLRQSSDNASCFYCHFIPLSHPRQMFMKISITLLKRMIMTLHM